MKIWCLFSITNEYYQPKNNLRGWWIHKPTTAQLSDAIGYVLDTIQVEKIESLKEVRIGNNDYRLEHIEEGIIEDFD